MQFFFGLAGFRLESYRGVEVGCEAPYLRYVSQNFLDGFCTLLIFRYASAHTALQGGLVPWYLWCPRFPLCSREGVFLHETRQANNLHIPPALRTLWELGTWESSR